MNGPEKVITNQYNLVENFERNPVLFLGEKSVVSFEEVDEKRREAGADLLYVCDFAIDGIEEFEKDDYFFQREKVINIDHHSASPNYKRHISSANLAIEYIKNHPDFLADAKALTHHTDCDSVLSTALMAGIIQPEEKFGVAAIAADHTGEANDIADLLQALKDGPNGEGGDKSSSEDNRSKYLYSLEQLQNLLTGKELDPRAKELYEKRLQERKMLQEMITSGQVKYAGNNQEVAYIETGADKFDATLLAGLLPNTKVIFTARQNEEGKTIIGVRMGLAMEEGSDLRDIMRGINEPFGGRWNAGSNKRKGGSDSSARQIAQKIANYLS